MDLLVQWLAAQATPPPMRPLCFVLALTLASVSLASAGARRVIDPQRYHLGVAGMPEWAEFEGATPHGPQLAITFSSVANAEEATLLIRQRNVKATWNVMLNGGRLGALETLTQPLVLALRVPAGALKEGENQLLVTRPPSRIVDDIVVGEIALDVRPRATALGDALLEIAVTDGETNAELPCRVTLTDAEAALMPFHALPTQRLALRTGVIYTGDGKARIGVAPGSYVVYAGRGFEYGVAEARVTLAAGETKPVALAIRREVPTPGWVAADSHIHTLTYSKHGDATVDERMVTIAGEGIELAIATEHNHHADYTAAASRTGTSAHFLSVVGNEVTTKVGHFNAFPVQPGSAVPDAQLTDWTGLWQNIRSVTGAKVITLNHPRDVHQAFTPLGPENFRAENGELTRAARFDCDAIEIVTSAAMQSDVMLLYRDWFALLNHGHRVAGIAASDTHHVSEFILGQARTYVACDAKDPGKIDIDEVCESYRAGRLLISLGLLTQMTIDDRFKVGDLATGLGETVKVTVEVLGPSWTTADRLELYANGVKVREAAIAPTSAVRKTAQTWLLPRPKHDVHLVAVATGPGVTAPYWEIPRPYQPTSKVFTSRVIGSTNPIWIDGDGDGKFSAARAYAAELVARARGDEEKLKALLSGYDAAVAAQAAAIQKRE